MTLTQFWTPVKFAESNGAPPATAVKVLLEEVALVIVTSIPAEVSLTAVAGKFTVVGAMVKAGVPVPLRVMVPEAWPLIEKLVVVVNGPVVVGVNVYVKAQDAPGARVTPTQFWNPLKFTVSIGAPPATAARVWLTPDALVIVTSIPAEVSPTTVVGKVIVVGAMVKAGVPVPLRVMVPEGCPLIEKFVVVVNGPVVVGVNVYVKAQDAPGARVTPAQFWTVEKLAASNGTPPATVVRD